VTTWVRREARQSNGETDAGLGTVVVEPVGAEEGVTATMGFAPSRLPAFRDAREGARWRAPSVLGRCWD
jgi:hypothetical protein